MVIEELLLGNGSKRQHSAPRFLSSDPTEFQGVTKAPAGERCLAG
jgi:hypothetical protein